LIATLVRSPRYKWYAFGALSVGTFASVVDHSSVAVALPSIATYFHTDLPSVQWVVIGFAMTIIALLLPVGRLADLVGLKKVYIAGSIVLIVGAIFAGASDRLSVLLLARIIQGAGAAMTQGTGMAIIVAVFPASERGKAIGLIMTMVGAGAIAGPAVGGLLVDFLGWRSVFLANVPVVAVGVALGLAVLSDPANGHTQGADKKGGFDWLGASLSSLALLAFLIAITNAHRTGWLSLPILAAAAGFAALLATFLWWEGRCSSPMLDLSFFRKRSFTLGVSAAFLTFVGSSAVLFMTPFYLQNVLGYSPRAAGLVVVPGALCLTLLGPASGRLSDRYGWRIFTVGGLGLGVCGLSLLTRLTQDSSLLLVIPALVLQSCGMGVFYSPNSSSVLSAVGRESYGVVSGFLNLVRNTGNVTSVAVATAIVTATMGSLGYEPNLDAVRGGTDIGVRQAFTVGLKYAYITMAGSLLAAMAISALKPGRPAPLPESAVVQ
jgi:EmrB/QacA subfamily drug resistance transporter